MAALSACALFMKSPAVRIAGVSVGALGLDGATARIALEVSNPNGFTLTSAGLEYLFAFQEGDPTAAEETAWRVIAEGFSDESASVPGNETRQVTLSIPFRYQDVGRAVQQFRDEGGLRYRLTGRVRFDAPLRDVQVPFEQTGTMGL
jgi:LEA14-like dessication related protein